MGCRGGHGSTAVQHRSRRASGGLGRETRPDVDLPAAADAIAGALLYDVALTRQDPTLELVAVYSTGHGRHQARPGHYVRGPTPLIESHVAL